MANLVNGGVMKDLKLSNADAGDKRFFGIKDEASMYYLPTYSKSNVAASNHVIISSMNPVLGGFKCVVYNDMSELNSAFEYLNNIAASLNPVSMTIKNINGVIYSGTGTIEVDRIELDTMKSTISFEMVSSDLAKQ